ncbi:MAG: aromatic ring-hydroxylating dioxygenase subunit alpha [Xanthobacteraceae bacterium]
MTSTTARRLHEYPEVARGVPQGLELGLRNYWYPVLQSEELQPKRPLGFMALGEALVAWRDAQGRPHVMRDKCPHRAAKLSAGRVLDGALQCAWHGLRFDGTGKCVMIPWEPDESKIPQEISVKSYPSDELGGYVWAYIGEPEKFQPPPLADSVPEELAKPEEFIWFRMPTDVWQANWLQSIESSDGFHAVMLHSESQAVATEEWKGGRPKKASVPIENRRMQVVKTPQGFRGVALDPEGNPIHHGHFLEGWKGERWTLPCLHTIPLRPVPNADPYASRLFQFPIDAARTQTVRFLAWRAKGEKERAQRQKLWDEVVYQRQIEVSGEDKAMIETLEPLVPSRSEEYLLFPDQDVLAVRRKLANAFLTQLDGARPMPSKDALAYPV